MELLELVFVRLKHGKEKQKHNNVRMNVNKLLISVT